MYLRLATPHGFDSWAGWWESAGVQREGATGSEDGYGWDRALCKDGTQEERLRE